METWKITVFSEWVSLPTNGGLSLERQQRVTFFATFCDIWLILRQHDLIVNPSLLIFKVSSNIFRCVEYAQLWVEAFRLANTTTKYWPLMADSTLSNSRNILTASSSRTSAIWKEMCVFVYRLYRLIAALTSQVAVLSLTSKMTHLTTLPYFSHSSFVSPSRSSSTSPLPTMFYKTKADENKPWQKGTKAFISFPFCYLSKLYLKVCALTALKGLVLSRFLDLFYTWQVVLLLPVLKCW